MKNSSCCDRRGVPGRLMAVVYKFGLFSALLRSEWFAGSLPLGDPPGCLRPHFLDSWIMAILSLLKEPECNELARPLQYVREHLDQPVENRASGMPAPSKADAALEHIVQGDTEGAENTYFRLPSDQFPGPRGGRRASSGHGQDGAALGAGRTGNHLQEHLATETIRTLIAGLTANAPEPGAG